MDNKELENKKQPQLSEAELDEVHGGVFRRPIFYCRICGKKFSGNAAYERHMKQEHQIG